MIALSLCLTIRKGIIKCLKNYLHQAKHHPRYNNDCSTKGIASNFIKIRKDAAVSKPISTGSIIGDYAITKIPYIGQAIKAYNKGSFGGSHLAHGINAYNESCRSRKKK